MSKYQSDITKVIPADSKDYSQSVSVSSGFALKSISFGQPFYIIEPPYYAVDPKTRKCTNRFQKFVLVKAKD